MLSRSVAPVAIALNLPVNLAPDVVITTGAQKSMCLSGAGDWLIDTSQTHVTCRVGQDVDERSVAMTGVST